MDKQSLLVIGQSAQSQRSKFGSSRNGDEEGNAKGSADDNQDGKQIRTGNQTWTENQHAVTRMVPVGFYE
ncbi:MAG: hypothetical protein RL069_3013 [Planctomycetota bacterium]